MTTHTTSPIADWTQRLQESRSDRDAAQARYEQTVRDAHADGLSKSAIARAFGSKSREQIHRYIDAPQPDDLPPVKLPLVVAWRAPGRSPETIREFGVACAARGWLAVGQTEAWHLSRGGATAVDLCFAASLGGSMALHLVTAKYDQGEHVWKRLAGDDFEGLPTRWDREAKNAMGGHGATTVDVQALMRRIAALADVTS